MAWMFSQSMKSTFSMPTIDAVNTCKCEKCKNAQSLVNRAEALILTYVRRCHRGFCRSPSPVGTLVKRLEESCIRCEGQMLPRPGPFQNSAKKRFDIQFQSSRGGSEVFWRVMVDYSVSPPPPPPLPPLPPLPRPTESRKSSPNDAMTVGRRTACEGRGQAEGEGEGWQARRGAGGSGAVRLQKGR